MQTRKNPFVVMAGLYFTVGLLAVAGNLAVETGLVESLPRIRWLTIHLVTIGGMTQALFGMVPSLVSESGESRPNGGLRWGQWVSLNAGYPLVLIGMATGSIDTAVAGATIVLAALGLLFVTIYRTSTRGRDLAGSSAGGPDPTGSSEGGADSAATSEGRRDLVRYYLTAPWFLAVGILAAFGMLLGVHGPGGYFGTIEAHVHANVWGFLALVVAAALLAVLPALLDADLRYPRLVPVTYWGVTLGAVGLVAGPWLARNELTVLGLGVYVVGTAALLANVVGTYRASGGGATRRIALVLGAYLWLVFPVPWAPLVLLYPDVVPAGAIEIAAINGLVFGWMLQLAMAFLPVVAAASGRPTDEGFVETVTAVVDGVPRPSWLQVGSVNVGVAALWLAALPPFAGSADALSLGGYALIGIGWALFVVALWRTVVDSSVPRAGRDGAPQPDPAVD